MEYVSKSAEETQSLAADFARQLHGGEVIALIGDLGTGKTTFVRGVVQALGGTVKVKSPTFTVMNEYPVSYNKIRRVIHLDLYRFQDEHELEALALEDEIRPDSLVFIEWPNVLETMPWSCVATVTLLHASNDLERIINIDWRS